MTVFTSRNRGQWLSVAQFLGAFAIRRYDAERAALSQPSPDGNHGENLNQAQA